MKKTHNNNISNEGYCRLAVKADLDDIRSIMVERNEWLSANGHDTFNVDLAFEYVKEQVSTGNAVAYVYNDEVCGFKTFTIHESFIYGRNAFSRLKCEGQGIFFKMIDFIVETFDKCERGDVTLPNDELLQYYIDHGAVPLGRITDEAGFQHEVLEFGNINY